MSRSIDELLALEFEKPPYLIEEGLLNDNSIMVIGGAPKARKSFFACTIAMHLATGTNLFGAYRIKGRDQEPAFKVCRPCRVLLLEQEIGDFSLQGRVAKMASGLTGEARKLFGSELHIHSCDRDLRLDTHPGFLAIGRLLDEVRPDILIIDPIVEFHTQDENSAHAMTGVFRNIDALRETYKCAIVLVHHNSKSGIGNNRLRGSNALYGKGDTFLMMDVVNHAAGLVRVTPTIRRDAPIRRFLVKLDKETLTFKFQSWKDED